MLRDTGGLVRVVALCGVLIVAPIAGPRANAAASLNFPPTDFDILSAESGQLIGHGHYNVDQTGGALTLRGENRYLNGEYDVEEEKLTIAEDDQMPTLTSFRHDFFNADGSPSMEARLEVEHGLAVCGRAVNGKLASTSENLSVPEDAYAGAGVLLPIQQFIRHGDRSATLKLHVFNCAPTPKFIAVDVKPQPHLQPWADYPGQLDKVDVKANFGFWTVVIQPFIPKLAAWFDPAQDALLVGAQLQRYYKGPKIVLVRKHAASISRGAATDKAPRMVAEPSPEP